MSELLWIMIFMGVGVSLGFAIVLGALIRLIWVLEREKNG